MGTILSRELPARSVAAQACRSAGAHALAAEIEQRAEAFRQRHAFIDYHYDRLERRADGAMHNPKAREGS